MKTAESFKTLNVWTSAPEPPRDCGRRGFAAARANASVAAAFWNFVSVPNGFHPFPRSTAPAFVPNPPASTHSNTKTFENIETPGLQTLMEVSEMAMPRDKLAGFWAIYIYILYLHIYHHISNLDLVRGLDHTFASKFFNRCAGPGAIWCKPMFFRTDSFF